MKQHRQIHPPRVWELDENHGDRMLGYALLYMGIAFVSGVIAVVWRLFLR